MKCLLNRLFSAGTLLLLLAFPAAAESATQSDSLRQLVRWPLAVQLRLVRTTLAPAASQRVAILEELLHQQGQRLDHAVYRALVGNLADYYTRRAQELGATAGRAQAPPQRLASWHSQAPLPVAERGRSWAWAAAAWLAMGWLTTLGAIWWAGRQRRLRAQREEHLRRRLAADLHGEVGTLLARVDQQADLLHQQQPEPDPAIAHLLGNSRAAAHTMRDIVWGIDAQADTVGALLDRMREHLDQAATPTGLVSELHTDGLRTDLALRSELRQHLYLVFKEAVGNTLRHASLATKITVTLTRYPLTNDLILTIEDDGRPDQPPARSGAGLRTLHQRATDLRGKLWAGTQPNGFCVRLQVPC